MGGWHEKDVRLIVDLEEDIWYWALVNHLAWDWTTRVCSWLHYVKLPKFILDWERHWDEDDPEYLARFEDWFGDNLGNLWHVYVEDPICQWAWRHRDYKRDVGIRLTLDEARGYFGADHESVKWVEREIAEHTQYDAERVADIRAKFASGEYDREKAIERLSWVYDADEERLALILDGKAEKADE
jgi:hypothetical protein